MREDAIAVLVLLAFDDGENALDPIIVVEDCPEQLILLPAPALLEKVLRSRQVKSGVLSESDLQSLSFSVENLTNGGELPAVSGTFMQYTREVCSWATEYNTSAAAASTSNGYSFGPSFALGPPSLSTASGVSSSVSISSSRGLEGRALTTVAVEEVCFENCWSPLPSWREEESDRGPMYKAGFSRWSLDNALLASLQLSPSRLRLRNGSFVSASVLTDETEWISASLSTSLSPESVHVRGFFPSSTLESTIERVWGSHGGSSEDWTLLWDRTADDRVTFKEQRRRRALDLSDEAGAWTLVEVSLDVSVCPCIPLVDKVRVDFSSKSPFFVDSIAVCGNEKFDKAAASKKNATSQEPTVQKSRRFLSNSDGIAARSVVVFPRRDVFGTLSPRFSFHSCFERKGQGRTRFEDVALSVEPVDDLPEGILYGIKLPVTRVLRETSFCPL